MIDEDFPLELKQTEDRVKELRTWIAKREEDIIIFKRELALEYIVLESMYRKWMKEHSANG
jgi:hypothetical protein